MVVDVQQGFDEAVWGPRNNPLCEDNIALLLDAWRQRTWPIVFVRHDSRDLGSPLRPGQPGNDLKPIVGEEPDLLVTKHVNSSFYGHPDLHEWLKANRISAVAICGITTNHCCETTARMAGNLGYVTWFVLDATYTFDRKDLHGRWVSADDLAGVTATNLNGEFATVLNTSEVLARLASSST